MGAARRAPSAPRSAPAPSRCSSRLAAGEIKACWIICTNPVATVANRSTVIAGLEAAELVITQDAYRDTATNRYADIVLPAALWAESDAVMVNSERNLTLLQQSIPPAGRGAAGLGADLPGRRATWASATHFAYESQRGDLRRDPRVRQSREPATTCAAPATTGCARHRCSGRARPGRPAPTTATRSATSTTASARTCSSTSDGHRPRLAFATPSRRAVFHPRPHMDARRAARRRLPVRAQHRSPAAPVAHDDQDRQGRQAQQAQPRARSSRSTPTTPPRSASPTGSQVELTSRRGRAVLPAVVTDRVRPGNCFAPFHWNDEHGEYLDDQRASPTTPSIPIRCSPSSRCARCGLRPVPVDGRSDCRSSDLAWRQRPDAHRRRKALPRRLLRRHRRRLAGCSGAAGGGTGRRATVRLWVDGLLAGTLLAAATGRRTPTPTATARWCCGRRRPATPRSSPPQVGRTARPAPA